jgi:DNA-binding CsgD family transcriptional regulator
MVKQLQSFFEIKVSYPHLTKKDIDFLLLINLNLNNNEITTLINISYESLLSQRYLLRKKIELSIDNDLIVFLGTI